MHFAKSSAAMRLRTRVVEVDGVLKAAVGSADDWKMDVHSLAGVPESHRSNEIDKFVSGEAGHQFDLSSSLPIRP